MILNIQIKLLSEFLGSSKLDENNIRKIATIGGKPKLFVKNIIDTIKSYSEDLGIDSKLFDNIEISPNLNIVSKNVKYIIVDKTITSAKTRRKNKESYEAIPAGTVLEFSIRFPACNSCNIEDIRKILKLIGEIRGISPFGSKWGYGLFEIVNISHE